MTKLGTQLKQSTQSKENIEDFRSFLESGSILKNFAIYCQITILETLDLVQPFLDISNLAFFQAPTSLAPNQLRAGIGELESTVIQCSPV